MTATTSRPQLTFVIGCTGCGKGSLGRSLAARIGAEIISADSMKVYRRMDIGTAKPSASARAAVPHHLVDVVEPSEAFSVAEYVERADAAIAELHARHTPILVVGGTPLYIKALGEGLFEGPSADPVVRAQLRAEAERVGIAGLHERLAGVDPAAAARIHPNDLRRIVRALEVYELTGQAISSLQTQWNQHEKRYDCTFIGLRRDRADQNSRTNVRVQRMLDAGWADEVRTLLAEPAPLSTTARQALGYPEMIDHVEGRLTLAEAAEKVKINTRRLAKAQRTWFKRFTDAIWLDLQPDDVVEEVVDRLMAQQGMRWSPSPK